MKLLRKITLLVVFLLLGVVAIKVPWELLTSVIKTWSSPTLRQAGMVALQMIICALMFGLVYLFAVKISNRSLKDYGIFLNRRTIRHISWGFLLTALAALLTWGFVLMVAGPEYEILFDSYLALGITITFSMLAVFFQVLYEELWCRSWVLVSLADLFNEKIAVVLMGIFFGMIHLLNPEYKLLAAVNAGLGGVLMSSAFFRFSSIWVAVGLHFGWNFILGGLVYNHYLFKVVLNDKTIANQFTAGEATWAGCIFIALSCWVIWMVPIKTRSKII